MERAPQAMPQAVEASETGTFMGPLQMFFWGMAAGGNVVAIVTKKLMNDYMQKSGNPLFGGAGALRSTMTAHLNEAQDSLELGMLPRRPCAPPRAVFRRGGAPRCSAAADLCVELGATAEQAAKAEGQLLPSIANALEPDIIQQRCDLLQQQLGLSKAELLKVVLRLPAVLSYSVEVREKKLKALQQRLGLSDTELKTVVLRLPAVLGYNVEVLEKKLKALQQRLGLSEAELRKVVLRLPPVLSYSVEKNVLPKLDWLQQRLGLREAELQQVVLRLPPVLGLSVEKNLAPKLDWLQEELGLSDEALRELILAKPDRLGYSLEKRYRPRLEACRLAGADERRVFTLAALTDSDFSKSIGMY